MTLYVYACECGNREDKNHSITESPNYSCQKCGGPMRRIPQAPRVSFSGSGFYSTDKHESNT